MPRTDRDGPGERAPEQPAGRESWLTGGDDGAPADRGEAGSDHDPFAALFGGEGRKKRKVERPDPDKPLISDRELNVHFKVGLEAHEYPNEEKRGYEFGDAGSNWRMMKLKRVLETAKEEGRSPEDVWLERYGSTTNWEDILAEREELDRRAGRKRRTHCNNGSAGRADRVTCGHGYSGGSNQVVGYRPNDAGESSGGRADKYGRSLKQSEDLPQVPPAFSLPAPAAASESTLPLTKDQLNKLNAKVLRARMLGSPNLAELERQLEAEKKRMEEAAAAPGSSELRQGKNAQQKAQETTIVLPRVDSTGKLSSLVATKEARRAKASSARDKSGQRLSYGYAGEGVSLEELVRQERGGRRENMAATAAERITRDAAFSDDLEYMDEHADKMARVKERTEEQKKQLAINDFRKTSKALERCIFCPQEGEFPRAAIVSRGRHVLLALPSKAELTPGHCLIVPVQHVVTSVECDDDVWDEIRNFQKCLLRMFDEANRGCVFMETVVNLDRYKHTVIECIPLPREAAEDAPAYFKEAILGAGEEWSQHRKLIPTSKERNIRKSLTKHLPYFHVWMGLDKGYGTVIEDSSFPETFGAEVIGGMCDLPPNLWRKPRRYDFRENARRVHEFRKMWEKWDWTTALLG